MGRPWRTGRAAQSVSGRGGPRSQDAWFLSRRWEQYSQWGKVWGVCRCLSYFPGLKQSKGNQGILVCPLRGLPSNPD